ncbi:hypothetical protein [Acinetobacter sp.]|uniref:hypothetical protein n=1 Tax=Acinetobacter sp. TaxID=472 RepID=UPI0035B13EAE
MNKILQDVTVLENKLALDGEQNTEVRAIEPLDQEQQQQTGSSDWSSGIDAAEIAMDVIDAVGNLLSGIDLSIWLALSVVGQLAHKALKHIRGRFPH